MPAKIEEARFSASFDSGMDDRPMEWTPPPGGIATTFAAPLRAAELHLQADARRRVEPTVRCSHGRGTKTPTAASTMAVAGLSAPAHVLSGLLALRPAQAKSLRRDVCFSTDLPGFAETLRSHRQVHSHRENVRIVVFLVPDRGSQMTQQPQ